MLCIHWFHSMWNLIVKTFELQVVHVVNSGSEANELAMMLARLYTGNLGMISLRNAYHGGTAGTMGLTVLTHGNTQSYHRFVSLFIFHHNIQNFQLILHMTLSNSNRSYYVYFTNYVSFSQCRGCRLAAVRNSYSCQFVLLT